MTLRSSKISGTIPAAISWAKPSTIAVLPTPASPISTGLFFVRRHRIWTTRRISSLRPMTGSNSPARASSVRSRPKVLSNDRRSLRPGRLASSEDLREEGGSSPCDSSPDGGSSPFSEASEAEAAGSISARISLRQRSKSTSSDCSTRAATPSPSFKRPSKICSVPT